MIENNGRGYLDLLEKIRQRSRLGVGGHGVPHYLNGRHSAQVALVTLAANDDTSRFERHFPRARKGENELVLRAGVQGQIRLVLDDDRFVLKNRFSTLENRNVVLLRRGIVAKLGVNSQRYSVLAFSVVYVAGALLGARVAVAKVPCPGRYRRTARTRRVGEQHTHRRVPRRRVRAERRCRTRLRWRWWTSHTAYSSDNGGHHKHVSCSRDVTHYRVPPLMWLLCTGPRNTLTSSCLWSLKHTQA